MTDHAAPLIVEFASMVNHLRKLLKEADESAKASEGVGLEYFLSNIQSPYCGMIAEEIAALDKEVETNE